MISDYERRAVAAQMREIQRENPHGWLDAMVMNAVIDVLGDGRKIGEIVADLIDRPTCHDTSDNDYEFKCSNCSAYTLKPGNYCSEVGYMSGSGEHLRYCQNCGAEIVDD